MGVLTAKDVRQRAQKALESSPFYALRELHVEQDGETLLICHELLSQAVGPGSGSGRGRRCGSGQLYRCEL